MSDKEKGREIVPFDEPRAILPAMSIDAAIEQWNQYQELKKRIGTDEDFQRIGDKLHPCKSFVRKAQKFFAVSCEILKDEPWSDVDGKVIGWMFTVRAIHNATGLFQDADGSCEFSEKRAANQKTLHNVRAHALTRAKNRAILDLVGFGEVSAEEIIQEKREKRESRKPKAESKPPADADYGTIPERMSKEHAGKHIGDRSIPISWFYQRVEDMRYSAPWRAAFKREIEMRQTEAGVQK